MNQANQATGSNETDGKARKRQAPRRFDWIFEDWVFQVLIVVGVVVALVDGVLSLGGPTLV